MISRTALLLGVMLSLASAADSPVTPPAAPVPTPANAAPGPILPEPFGLLQLDVTPGVRRVFVDRETVLNHAENMVLTAGAHRLDLIAPPGYADTSLTVTMENRQTLKLQIELRNISGMPLPPTPGKTACLTFGPAALLLTALLSAGAMAAILLFIGK